MVHKHLSFEIQNEFGSLVASIKTFETLNCKSMHFWKVLFLKNRNIIEFDDEEIPTYFYIIFIFLNFET
jgi:hypothetical protein